MKNKRANKKTRFKQALSYLKETKKYIFYSFLIFFLSLLLGFIFHEQLTFIDKYLAELIAKTEGLSSIEMILFILQNNLQSSLLSIFLGIFIGIFPLFSAISNGVIIGYVLARTLQVVSIASWWRILPHGIFELPAIFISFGIGIKLGFGLVINYFKQYWKKSKSLVYFPPAIALFLSAINLIFMDSLIKNLPKQILFISNNFLIPLVIMGNFVFYLIFFVIGSYIFDSKLRKIQNAHLKYNIYNSANVFLMIVIPLLVIAAIIEGLLIGLLR